MGFGGSAMYLPAILGLCMMGEFGAVAHFAGKLERERYSMMSLSSFTMKARL